MGVAMSNYRQSPTLSASCQQGFTLIELIAAFVIFALGFGILLQILSTCLHTTASAANYTRAALWAQSLMDVQGIGEPLREGNDSGRFDDKFSWTLHIAKVDPPPVQQTTAPIAGNTGDQAPVLTQVVNNMDLFDIALDVSWGSYYLTHHARFETLRAQSPDAGNQPGNNFVPGGVGGRMPQGQQ